MDDVLRSAVEDGDVVGVVAVVVDASGPVYEATYGRRTAAPDGDAPMSADTVFRVASMTKAVTATAVMQLVEHGRIALDQPVEDILPAFGELQVLAGFSGEAPRLRPPEGRATVEQLLTNTCGLAYETWNADVARYQRTTGVPSVASGRRAAFRNPLVCDPGTRWEYGPGLDWAGQVVESVSGQRLDIYFQQHLLGPLRMPDTAFRLSEDQRSRLATVHRREEDGTLTPRPPKTPREMEFLSGGQGLYSTARDFARFLLMLLAGGSLDGGQVLRQESVLRMMRNSIGELDVIPQRTVMPRVSNDVEFFPGRRKKHGLGLQVLAEDVPGMRAAGAVDWAGLFNTYYWVDPVHGIAGAIFTQILPFFDARTLRVYEAFERAVYAQR